MNRTLRDRRIGKVGVSSRWPAAQNLPESGVEGAEAGESGHMRVPSALLDALLLVRHLRGGRVRDDVRQRRLLREEQDGA